MSQSNFFRHVKMFQWLNMPSNSHILKQINQKGYSTPSKIENFLKREFEQEYEKFLLFLGQDESPLYRGIIPVNEKKDKNFRLVEFIKYTNTQNLKDLANMAGIPGDYLGDEQPQQIIENAKSFQEALMLSDGLYLEGNTGTGKTHSAIATALRYARLEKEVAGKYPSVYFYSDGFNYKIGEETEPIIFDQNNNNPVMKIPYEIKFTASQILILDDFLLNVDEKAINYYLTIVAKRNSINKSYSNIKLKTIFTSNFTLEFLSTDEFSERYGKQDARFRIILNRLISRIHEAVGQNIVNMDDIDHRRIWG